jgi:hypothetical protein
MNSRRMSRRMTDRYWDAIQVACRPIDGPCQAAYLAWFLRTEPQFPTPPIPILRSLFLPCLNRSISAQYAATRPVPCHTTRRRGDRLESRFLDCGVCLTHTHARSLRKSND